MMVTEYAPCGSLADAIKKRDEPSERMKAKLMLDAAKGLAYLHENGILHRDIKPDNVLVFSLDKVIAVNGKLTDFGSSRNINLLMTNMTFTKGIGTPVYMAPEVLNKEKCKKAADVYSFGVTMYEAFKWGTPTQRLRSSTRGTLSGLSRVGTQQDAGERQTHRAHLHRGHQRPRKARSRRLGRLNNQFTHSIWFRFSSSSVMTTVRMTP